MNQMTVVEMKIKGLMIDPVSNMPIIVLKNQTGETVLPIWVGIFEANAIALEMEKIKTPRPMTHDLIMNILGALEAEVKRVVVHDLRENTFFASIVVDFRGSDLVIDSRPSDAIALALRCNTPIFVAGHVIDKSHDEGICGELYDEAKLKSWLENITPQDFDKHPL